jgi:fucose permease
MNSSPPYFHPSNACQLETYYDLSYTVVSLVFLSPFAGYTLAAIVNNMMHVKFGQRGVAIVGPACHLVSYIVLAVHPPYPVLVVMFLFVGLGNGLIDAAWCAWIGNMANANEVSGFLQACYALGATVAPLIATAMFTKGGLGWYTFYYIMVSIQNYIFLISSDENRLPGPHWSLEHPLSPSGSRPAPYTNEKTPQTQMQKLGELVKH